MTPRTCGVDVVDTAVSELLRLFPRPAEANPVAFLGAQFDLGLAWVHFEPGNGGLGQDPGLQHEIDRILTDVEAPAGRADFVAVHQVAATLNTIGETHQQLRFLRSIFTGEHHWCQLFSEPGAGSDLAGVATLAARDDDGWLVTGQKVWTSGARQAHFALLLARTDPDVPKHRGLTMFIVDMSADGIEVRPLRQADGGARFSEVFLTDVRIPDAMRLGPIGDGWGVALRVLRTERSGASDVFIRPVEELLELWRRRRGYLPAAMRDEVVTMWMDAAVFALSRDRQRAVAGTDDAARLGAIAKVAASEHAQRLSAVMAAVLGPAIVTRADYDDAFATDTTGEESTPTRFAALPPHRYLLRTRAMSIEGGTNEISRNIISERILGLPADIRVDKDRSWRELVRY